MSTQETSLFCAFAMNLIFVTSVNFKINPDRQFTMVDVQGLSRLQIVALEEAGPCVALFCSTLPFKASPEITA